MDRASLALAQELPSDVRKSYAVIADRSGVPLTTVWYRDHGRPSIEEKAQRQQYLAPEEEIALIGFSYECLTSDAPYESSSYLP